MSFGGSIVDDGVGGAIETRSSAGAGSEAGIIQMFRGEMAFFVCDCKVRCMTVIARRL